LADVESVGVDTVSLAKGFDGGVMIAGDLPEAVTRFNFICIANSLGFWFGEGYLGSFEFDESSFCVFEIEILRDVFCGLIVEYCCCGLPNGVAARTLEKGSQKGCGGLF